MKRVAAILVMIPLAVGSMGLRIPRGHRNDPPKTVADQEKENAAAAQKKQDEANKKAADYAAKHPQPTTEPSQSAALSKAQADLTKIERHLREVFEKGEDYTKASGNLTKSQEAYEAAYKSMVTKLSDDPAYAAAVKRQAKAEGDLAAAKAGSADHDEAATLAGQAMDARTAVHKLEADAAEKDEAVKGAKGKVAESKSAMDALKKSFEEGMKADPQYAAAKQAVEAARPAKV